MTSGKTVALSVVVPCYNESGVISQLLERLKEVCTQVASSFEIILVNDGSKDSTWPEIQAACDVEPCVVGINLARNHGHQLALTAGLSAATGERILIIDADLQDPPELLPKMMQEMDAGADVVYGQRETRQGETWFKLKTAELFYRILARLADIDIPRDTGDFRLMNRRALDALMRMPESHRFIRGMVSWIGFKQVALKYERHARFAGESKYPLSKMIRFALDAITGFSVIPLRLATYLGLFTAACASLVGLYSLIVWMVGHVVAGWTSLMIVMLFLGGAQLIVLGIIGEYLGRVFVEAKRRPLFIIESVYRGTTSSTESTATPSSNS